MGNRNVSIYCFGESNEQSLNLVSMRRNLNCEIVIDTFILHHCDYNLFWFSQQYHAFEMHWEYLFSPLVKNLLGGAKELSV